MSPTNLTKNIQIFDLSGRLQYQSNESITIHKIDTKRWQKGTYQVKIQVQDRTDVFRIVKTKTPKTENNETCSTYLEQVFYLICEL